jgi:hypothetical protein
VKRFRNKRNVMKFMTFGDSTSSCIENKLETIRLSSRVKVQKKRMAVVKLRVNKRSSNSVQNAVRSVVKLLSSFLTRHMSIR